MFTSTCGYRLGHHTTTKYPPLQLSRQYATAVTSGVTTATVSLAQTAVMGMTTATTAVMKKAAVSSSLCIAVYGHGTHFFCHLCVQLNP